MMEEPFDAYEARRLVEEARAVEDPDPPPEPQEHPESNPQPAL